MMKSKILHICIFIFILSTITGITDSQSLQQSSCRTGLNFFLGPFSNARDSILVNKGNGCVVLDVNVIISNVSHTWDSDLIFYIRKGGVGSLIINKVGGSGDNFIQTVLNDSASLSISSGTAPFTGSYRPSNPLTTFNGSLTDGYWNLVINDTGCCDTGNLTAWCLQLTFTCPTGGIQTVEIPNTYRLYQNYPNPFNPVTKIKYGVPKNGYIKLTVYDELGKEVAIVDEGYKEANTYEAVFDATNLPSGVYYYKLESDGFTDTKKMVIIK